MASRQLEMPASNKASTFILAAKPSRNNRSGMPHTAGGGGSSGNESGAWLVDVVLDESRGFSSSASAISPIRMIASVSRVFVEKSDCVQVTGSVDRIASDSNTGGLTVTGAGDLPDRFIGPAPERETIPTFPGL